MAAVSQLARNSVGTPQLRNGAVTTPKIRNNAITSAKVRNRSLLAVDFRAGQLPQGPPGPAGPQGSPGPQGPAGPTGASGYQVITQASPSNSSTPKSLTATCPQGKVVIGGGARSFGAFGQAAIWLSGPDGPPAAPPSGVPPPRRSVPVSPGTGACASTCSA